MIKEILLPLFTIGLSELGDKTQLAIFCLSAKTNKKTQLLIGVLVAFLLTSFTAAFFGGILSTIINPIYLTILSGATFILFGILILTEKPDKKTICKIKKPFLSGFLLILLTEMGDKSQITTAIFSTQMTPLFVFIGSFLALTILSVIAIYLGNIIHKKINKRKISLISGIIFIVLGLIIFTSLF